MPLIIELSPEGDAIFRLRNPATAFITFLPGTVARALGDAMLHSKALSIVDAEDASLEWDPKHRGLYLARETADPTGLLLSKAMAENLGCALYAVDDGDDFDAPDTRVVDLFDYEREHREDFAEVAKEARHVLIAARNQCYRNAVVGPGAIELERGMRLCAAFHYLTIGEAIVNLDAIPTNLRTQYPDVIAAATELPTPPAAEDGNVAG